MKLLVRSEFKISSLAIVANSVELHASERVGFVHHNRFDVHYLRPDVAVFQLLFHFGEVFFTIGFSKSVSAWAASVIPPTETPLFLAAISASAMLLLVKIVYCEIDIFI